MAGNFQHVHFHKVLLNDEYELHIDEYVRDEDQFLLLHLRFLKWTPSVFKRFSAHWRALRSCVAAPLFALGECDDDKWQRFVTRFGFKYLHTVICENGESRRLFIHTSGPQGSRTSPEVTTTSCLHSTAPKKPPLQAPATLR